MKISKSDQKGRKKQKINNSSLLSSTLCNVDLKAIKMQKDHIRNRSVIKMRKNEDMPLKREPNKANIELNKTHVKGFIGFIDK
jgi:hypothetical protein